jgi:hypothetical protein
MKIIFDDFVKSPDTALRCILRHCGVTQLRLIPQNLRALSANFLQSHLIFDFLRVHHLSIQDARYRRKNFDLRHVS